MMQVFRISNHIKRTLFSLTSFHNFRIADARKKIKYVRIFKFILNKNSHNSSKMIQSHFEIDARKSCNRIGKNWKVRSHVRRTMIRVKFSQGNKAALSITNKAKSLSGFILQDISQRHAMRNQWIWIRTANIYHKPIFSCLFCFGAEKREDVHAPYPQQEKEGHNLSVQKHYGPFAKNSPNTKVSSRTKACFCGCRQTQSLKTKTEHQRMT